MRFNTQYAPQERYEYRGYYYNEHDEFHNLKLSPHLRQQIKKGRECTNHIALMTHPTLAT